MKARTVMNGRASTNGKTMRLICVYRADPHVRHHPAGRQNAVLPRGAVLQQNVVLLRGAALQQNVVLRQGVVVV